MPGDAAVALGGQAQGLLANTAFREAVARCDAKYVAQWRTSANSEQRERWWVRQSVLAEVVNELNALMNDGVVESALQEKPKPTMY